MQLVCIALFVSSVLFGFDGSIVRAFVFQLGGLWSFVLGGPTGPTGPTDVDELQMPVPFKGWFAIRLPIAL